MMAENLDRVGIGSRALRAIFVGTHKTRIKSEHPNEELEQEEATAKTQLAESEGPGAGSRETFDMSAHHLQDA